MIVGTEVRSLSLKFIIIILFSKIMEVMILFQCMFTLNINIIKHYILFLEIQIYTYFLRAYTVMHPISDL